MDSERNTNTVQSDRDNDGWVADKLEKTRRTALLLIRNADALEETDTLVLIQLCRLQQEIERLKHVHGVYTMSPLAWVDDWHPRSQHAAA